MKDIYVIDIKAGDNILDAFFIVRSAQIKVGSNRKKYFDMVLADSTGEIAAKKWDVFEEEVDSLNRYKAGDIIKVRATVNEFKGTRQLVISKIRYANPNDGIDKADFFKTAPEDSQDMYDFIMGRISAFEDEDLRKLCTEIYEDNREKLMYYPAAMSNHHAEYGGLLYHVKRMMMAGERLCEVYTNLSRDILLAGVAIHDIEKLNEILSDENGVSPGYSFEGQMLGHLVQGVRFISEKCKELGISEEKAIMLEHMVISHHYEPEFGSPRKPLFPEAEMLHYLDMIDAKMFDMEDALKGVEPGEFSERVWTLDNRKIYKRTF